MMIKKIEFIKSAEFLKDFPEERALDLVMVGKSNVGKSSFINKFTNRKSIARVSKNPGCTKLLNFFLVNNLFNIVDLPGYGFAKVPDKIKNRWKSVIEGYLKSDRFKIAFILVDAQRGIGKNEEEIVEWLNSNNIEYKILNTKTDKIKRNELRILKKDSDNFFISSKSGEGFGEIYNYLQLSLDKRKEVK